MDLIVAIKTFVRVVETGSFTKTAVAMQLPIASVSRNIQALEGHLGTKLFNRTTRAVRATEEGSVYYGRCLRLLAEIDDMEATIGEARINPMGRLKLALPATVANNLVIPALQSFNEQYPGLRIDMTMTDNVIDMVESEIDCSIRIGDVSEGGVIAKKVGDVRFVICASPDYLRRHGTPASLDELGSHTGITYVQRSSGRPRPWEVVVGGNLTFAHTKNTISVDDAASYVACGLSGLGLIAGSEVSLRPFVDEGKLVPILTDVETRSRPISVLFLPDRKMVKKIRVFVDWFSDLYSKAYGPSEQAAIALIQ